MHDGIPLVGHPLLLSLVKLLNRSEPKTSLGILFFEAFEKATAVYCQETPEWLSYTREKSLFERINVWEQLQKKNKKY